MDVCRFRALLMAVCACYPIYTFGLEYSIPHENNEYWNRIAKADIIRAKQVRPNIGVAKNVILFLGDGMGVSTVTAARILKGQLQNQVDHPGEEASLSFENFPHLGLSKTYNGDSQVADSAGTATAFFCGVKTNLGVIGLDGRSRRSNCSTKIGSEVTSILDWSKAAGKSVGIVTTTRITHATPSALYAHSADRDWESDVDMVNITGGCVDIAKQLIDDNHDIEVLLGGGRKKFLRQNDTDPKPGPNDDLTKDGRTDGRNLIEDWQKKQSSAGKSHKYVSKLSEFRSVDTARTDRLLGLFGYNHMQYHIDRDTSEDGEPALEEMTEKAIEILKKNPNGFFLMVEGGRIDHGHHETNAKRALYDTLAFDKAVTKAISMTSESDTLTITTADHSHVFTIAGYPKRGNPLFDLVMENGADNNKLADDNKPYTTLQYSNGPSMTYVVNSTIRPNLTGVDTGDTDFLQHGGVPLDSETHGGEDVAIYAQGPMSHLFHGTHEQHYIAHVMAYASCVGGYSARHTCAQADVDALLTSAVSHSKTCLGYLPFLVVLYVLAINF